jgi:hypothetical protein
MTGPRQHCGKTATTTTTNTQSEKDEDNNNKVDNKDDKGYDDKHNKGMIKR